MASAMVPSFIAVLPNSRYSVPRYIAPFRQPQAMQTDAGTKPPTWANNWQQRRRPGWEGISMRLIAIAAALLLLTAPAEAAWKSYKYAQYGFGIDFPAE